jgi:hypothetical protein
MVDRLVAGDYEGLKREGIDPYEDRDLGLWIREYGRAPGNDERGRATLAPLPEEAWESAEVVSEDPGPPRVWGIVIDLWTAEEGRSDLSRATTRSASTRTRTDRGCHERTRQRIRGRMAGGGLD